MGPSNGLLRGTDTGGGGTRSEYGPSRRKPSRPGRLVVAADFRSAGPASCKLAATKGWSAVLWYAAGGRGVQGAGGWGRRTTSGRPASTNSQATAPRNQAPARPV